MTALICRNCETKVEVARIEETDHPFFCCDGCEDAYYDRTAVQRGYMDTTIDDDECRDCGMPLNSCECDDEDFDDDPELAADIILERQEMSDFAQDDDYSPYDNDSDLWNEY